MATEITFKGYLTKRLKQITGAGIYLSDVYTIAEKNEVPYIRELLFLYCVAIDKTNRLLDMAVNNVEIQEEWRKILNTAATANIKLANIDLVLQSDTELMPESYITIYKDYVQYAAQKPAMLVLKQQIRNEIYKIIENKKISLQEAADIVGINHANFSSFIRGNMSALSVEKITDIYRQLKMISQTDGNV